MRRFLIYLDVCTLCRPFDDQSFLRIRLETDAVNLIMSKIHDRQLQLAVSPVHFVEIKAISDSLERMELISIVERYGMSMEVDTIVARKRAEELVRLGFGIADVAHVAFAEAGHAKFITCDDKLLKKCQKNNIYVWCGSPVRFCSEEDLR